MLSVVVADPPGRQPASPPCVAALTRELTDDDEVIWVGGPGGDRPTGVISVETPAASRGPFYAAGLERARRPLVAFTDTLTEPLPGWRAAAVAGLERDAVVVGGPVLPTAGRSIASFGGFVVEYGPHAVPPFTSATGDVAANNIAYRREALQAVLAPGEAMWKTVANRRLAAQGHGTVVAPEMRVLTLKEYAWSDLLSARAAHGRLYAAQRSVGWSRLHRWARAASCTLTPVVSFGRLTRRISHDPVLVRRLALSTPAVAVALAAWATGEALGYVAATPPMEDVF